MSELRNRPARALVRGLAGLALLSGSGIAAAPAHAAWTDVTRTCQVQDTRIVENSGMSRSTYDRGGYFVHNDSGGGARFFFIGADCQTQAVFDVPGAPAKDWEDMASGPNHTLWFGDIGGKRSEVNAVRVVEPETLTSRSLAYTSYRLAYPDGAHNAEAMMVHPTTGRLYVVTKARTGAGVYAAPATLSASGVNRMTRVASAPGQGLSGADYALDGSKFVLRGYRAAFVFSSIGGTATKVPLPDAHLFGEAVTFDRSASLVFGAEGVREWLWRIR